MQTNGQHIPQQISSPTVLLQKQYIINKITPHLLASLNSLEQTRSGWPKNALKGGHPITPTNKMSNPYCQLKKRC